MEEQDFKLKEKLDLVIQFVTDMKLDAVKFDQGNGAAGRRIRSYLSSLRQDVQKLRFDIQNEKNQRKQQKKTQTV